MSVIKCQQVKVYTSLTAIQLNAAGKNGGRQNIGLSCWSTKGTCHFSELAVHIGQSAKIMHYISATKWRARSSQTDSALQE